jgi:hypothetical protein
MIGRVNEMLQFVFSRFEMSNTTLIPSTNVEDFINDESEEDEEENSKSSEEEEIDEEESESDDESEIDEEDKTP